jgi:hypothetical protein
MTKEIERSVEGIHQELKGSELDFYRKDDKSLKYFVRNISTRLTEHLNAQKRRQEDESFDVRWSLGVIGCVGIILAITRSASSDIEWLSQHTLALRLWAVALSTIFVGVSLERSTLVRSLWRFSVTKFLLSLILSGAIFYARGKAAGFVNGVFHVDATAFPITLVLTTGLVLFKLLVPFALAVAGMAAAAHVLSVLAWLKDKHVGSNPFAAVPLYSLLFIGVSGVILFFGLSWSGGQLNDSRLPEKVYLMAHALDFNYSHECANVDPTRPVVFLGSAQESVLVAPYGLEDFDFGTFFEASVIVPTDFTREKCDYKPPVVSH